MDIDEREEKESGGAPPTASFSPDGKLLISRLKIWDLRSSLSPAASRTAPRSTPSMPRSTTLSTSPSTPVSHSLLLRLEVPVQISIFDVICRRFSLLPSFCLSLADTKASRTMNTNSPFNQAPPLLFAPVCYKLTPHTCNPSVGFLLGMLTSALMAQRLKRS